MRASTDPPSLLRSVASRAHALAPLSVEILSVSAPHVDPHVWRMYLRTLVQRYPARKIRKRIDELIHNGYLTRSGGTSSGWLTPKGAAALARKGRPS